MLPCRSRPRERHSPPRRNKRICRCCRQRGKGGNVGSVVVPRPSCGVPFVGPRDTGVVSVVPSVCSVASVPPPGGASRVGFSHIHILVALRRRRRECHANSRTDQSRHYVNADHCQGNEVLATRSRCLVVVRILLLKYLWRWRHLRICHYCTIYFG